MIFFYQAFDRDGNIVADFIDSPTETKARQKIRGLGLYLVKLQKHDVKQPVDSGTSNTGLRAILNFITNFVNIRASVRQVGLFSRQLATLLKAGLPLPVAITDIVEQIDNKYFRNIIADVKEKLEGGSSFSNALQQHRPIFSDMYINMVRVGENLGSLDQVIERLAENEEKKNILTSKIRSAMVYPSFMLLFAIAVVVFLMVNVIPTIATMFTELQKDLPLPTKIVIGTSNFLSDFWLLIPLAAIAVFIGYRRYSRTPEGRKKIDEYKLRVPLFKTIYNKLIVYRFTQNLGILLSNKVDLLKSFEIVKKIIGNVIIEEKITDAAEQIKEGTSVTKALKSTDFLPKLVIGMITAGEASDNLDTMLLNIGNVYETELDLTVTSITSLIEPIVIIIMGLGIALIVMSVILPITEMNLLVQ